MEFIHFLWAMTGVAIIVGIYNYIQLKREEREDDKKYEAV